MKSVLIGITVCIIATGAYSASFDCSKASTFIEKKICSDKQLSDLDELLMLAYKKARSNSTDSNSVKKQQRTWLKETRNKCQNTDCLKRVYTARIKDLVDVVISNSPSSAKYTGTYEMEGAEVKVQQISDNRIKFQIIASYQMNTGVVTGEALLSRDTAVYVDTEYDCGLLFRFSHRMVVIDQTGICGMGLNVSAFGEYRLTNKAHPKFDDI